MYAFTLMPCFVYRRNRAHVVRMSKGPWGFGFDIQRVSGY